MDMYEFHLAGMLKRFLQPTTTLHTWSTRASTWHRRALYLKE